MDPVKAMGPEASGDDEEPDYRAFSTMEAGEDGYIYYFGGGHNNYGGNDVDVYNVAENTWSQVTEEENWKTDCNDPGWEEWTCAELQEMFGSSSSPIGPTPRGRAWTLHTYQGMVWDKATDQACVIANGNEEGEGFVCYDRNKGDADGAWQTRMAGHPARTVWNGSGDETNYVNINYDDGLGTMVVFVGGGIRSAAKWDREAQDFVEIPGISLKQDKWGEVYSEYSPDHGLHLVRIKNTLQLVDLVGRSVKKITPLKEVVSDQKASQNYEYAPEIAKFLVISEYTTGAGQGLWAYDPDDDSWTELHLDGTKPAKALLRWDLFERDPVTGRYVQLVVDADHPERGQPKTYAFRIDTDVAQNQPEPCPADTCVGSGFRYSSFANAIANTPNGGTVGVADGTYYQCVIFNKAVTLKALSGRPHLTGSICDGKAVVVSKAAGTVKLQGLEVSGGTGVKGLWLGNDAGDLIIRDLKVHDSGMGIFAGPGAGRLEIYNSEIWDIHDNSEKAHFIYGAENDLLIAEGNYLHGGTDGHFIKAKSVDSALRYNYIDQEAFTDINLIDVWACGSNRIIGNAIRTVETDEAVNAIGLTRRTREDKPCPVGPRKSATVLFNAYLKRGAARWSTFIDNKENAALELKNNAIANARLMRRADDSWIGDDADNASPSGFADARLHIASTEAAVCASARPGKEYAHTAATRSRADGGDMGAYAADPGSRLNDANGCDPVLEEDMKWDGNGFAALGEAAEEGGDGGSEETATETDFGKEADQLQTAAEEAAAGGCVMAAGRGSGATLVLLAMAAAAGLRLRRTA
jgi:hypothetical protein